MPSTRDEADKLATELYPCFGYLNSLELEKYVVAFDTAGAKTRLQSLKGKTVEEIETKKKEVAEGIAKLEAATARVGELAPRVSVEGVQQAGLPGISSSAESDALMPQAQARHPCLSIHN